MASASLHTRGMSKDFPPTEPPADRAKYRQFLIDHQLDPNLNRDDLELQFGRLSPKEREQLENDWAAFLRA